MPAIVRKKSFFSTPFFIDPRTGLVPRQHRPGMERHIKVLQYRSPINGTNGRSVFQTVLELDGRRPVAGYQSLDLAIFITVVASATSRFPGCGCHVMMSGCSIQAPKNMKRIDTSNSSRLMAI